MEIQGTENRRQKLWGLLESSSELAQFPSNSVTQTGHKPTETQGGRGQILPPQGSGTACREEKVMAAVLTHRQEAKGFSLSRWS